MKIRNSIIKVSLCLIIFAFVFSCHKDVEVEDALPDCQSLNDMKAKLDQLNKTSSTDLNNLFSYYNNI
jgi:hypothetical protein